LLREQPSSSVQQLPLQYSFFISFLPFLLITRRFNPPSLLVGSITNKEADPAKIALVDEMVHLPHLGKMRREVKEEVMDADGASAAAEASPFHKRSRVSHQHQVGSPVFQFPFPSNISWFMHMNLSRTTYIGGKSLFLKYLISFWISLFTLRDCNYFAEKQPSKGPSSSILQ
jgi:hypothetical protein